MGTKNSSLEFSHEGGGSTPPFVSAPSSPGHDEGGGGHGSGAFMMRALPLCYYSAPASPSGGGGGCRNHQPEQQQQQQQGGRSSSSSPSSFNSEFEFSARFSVFDEAPMSPTPMYSNYSGKKDSINFFYDYRPKPLLTPPPSFCSRLSSCSLASSQAISAPQSPCSWRSVNNPPSFNPNSVEHTFTTSFPAAPSADLRRKTKGTGHRQTRSLSPLHFFRHKPTPKPPQNPPSNPPQPPGPSKRISKLKDLLHRLRIKDSVTQSYPPVSPGLFARSGSSSKSSSRSSSQSDPATVISSSSLSSSSSSSSSISRSSSSANERAPKQSKSKHIHMKKGGNNNNNNNNNNNTISPHELHYTFQRAQTKELRKKTFLPYRQSLLAGCLSFTSRSYGATVSTISRTIRPVS